MSIEFVKNIRSSCLPQIYFVLSDLHIIITEDFSHFRENFLVKNIETYLKEACTTKTWRPGNIMPFNGLKAFRNVWRERLIPVKLVGTLISISNMKELFSGWNKGVKKKNVKYTIHFSKRNSRENISSARIIPLYTGNGGVQRCSPCSYVWNDDFNVRFGRFKSSRQFRNVLCADIWKGWNFIEKRWMNVISYERLCLWGGSIRALWNQSIFVHYLDY